MVDGLAKDRDAVAAELASAARALGAEIAMLRARVDELEKRGGGTRGTPDDLRRVRGIGPRFESSLLAHGIESWAQIAAWTDADVDAMAKAIGATPERIRREGWVASARRLCGEK